VKSLRYHFLSLLVLPAIAALPASASDFIGDDFERASLGTN